MTEEDLEKKAEEYVLYIPDTVDAQHSVYSEEKLKQAYIDGYEQGQKDFDTDITKLLNSYGVKFIDTNSIGGLIALHQLMLDLEKENEELQKQIEKMKKCSNCNLKCNLEKTKRNECIKNKRKDWELAG